MFVVQQVSSNFSDRRFSTDNAWSESTAAERPPEVSWVVRRELFLVDWFEDSKRTTVRSLEDVAAASAFICQLRMVALAKSVLNSYNFVEIACQLCTLAVL